VSEGYGSFVCVRPWVGGLWELLGRVKWGNMNLQRERKCPAGWWLRRLETGQVDRGMTGDWRLGLASIESRVELLSYERR
jgi:hypothetical protein